MTNIMPSYPIITENDVASFEKTYKVALPITYRNSLLKYNGGVPDNIFFVKNNADVVINEFLSLKSGDLSIVGYLNDFPFNIKHLIPIAEDAFGNLILIACNSEMGALHFWNHETTAITNITNSFEYFIENLQGEVD